MKVSIITVVLNGEVTIRDTIESVLSQNYNDIEYIIVDGKSTDKTLEIVYEYQDHISKIISENDSGLYAAINKGISIASGDVVGLLHSDDLYTNGSVITTVVNKFKQCQVDTVFADLVYVKENNINKVIRYFSAKNFTPDKLTYGLMPPHPTFFVKKSVYDNYGYYKTDYRIAADYEMMVRLLYQNSLTYSYIHQAIVKMRVGGLSSGGIRNKILINREVVRALRTNGVNSNVFLILRKYPVKIIEIVKGYVYNVIERYKS